MYVISRNRLNAWIFINEVEGGQSLRNACAVTNYVPDIVYVFD